MPLAILCQSFGRFGGAERLTLSHFVQLKRMNVDVTLYYQGPLSPEWKKRMDCYDIRPIPTGISTSPSRLRDLPRFLREISQYDRILIHHHVEPILAFYLAKLFGPRIVWYSGSMLELAWEECITGQDYRSISTTVRHTGADFYGTPVIKILLSDPLYALTVKLARAVDLTTVKSYGKILANSTFLSNFLTKTLKLKEQPKVVYPGPDPILEQLSSNGPIAVEEDCMLCVGALIPLKNLETSIRAAATVPDARLSFVGEGQEEDKLRKLAGSLNVPVQFKGSTTDEKQLAMEYSQCKFLVHLSLYEPFGLAPVEAGLFSKPSIVTSRGGPRESVIDGETGFVTNPTNQREVSAKMQTMLSSQSLRKEMGRKARKNMTEKFTLRSSTKDLLAELEF